MQSALAQPYADQSEVLPITAHLGAQVLFDTVKVVVIELGESCISQDGSPCHDGRHLGVMIEWKTVAEIQELCQGVWTDIGWHLEGVFLGGVVHDVGLGQCSRHQGVSGHVLVFCIIWILHRMMHRLFVGVVRAYHEILHVVHARTLEPGAK